MAVPKSTAGVIKHRGRQGTWHNPVSLSRINADRVPDIKTCLRADDCKLLVGPIRNRKTVTLPSLDCDNDLRFAMLSHRFIIQMMVSDNFASPNVSHPKKRVYFEYSPDGVAIRHVSSRNAGVTLVEPHSVDASYHADYETVDVPDDRLPACLERGETEVCTLRILRLTMGGENGVWSHTLVEIGHEYVTRERRVGKLVTHVTRERYDDAADAVVDAIRSLGLLRIESLSELY